jgi:hypothetical protein
MRRCAFTNDLGWWHVTWKSRSVILNRAPAAAPFGRGGRVSLCPEAACSQDDLLKYRGHAGCGSARHFILLR